MKKFLMLSLLTTLSLTNLAKAELLNVGDGISSGAATVVSVIVNPAAGSIVYLKLVALELVAGTTLGVTAVAARKEIADQINIDLNEYNLSGELSPMLSEIVKAVQKSDADLSMEDILSNIVIDL